MAQYWAGKAMDSTIHRPEEETVRVRVISGDVRLWGTDPFMFSYRSVLTAALVDFKQQAERTLARGRSQIRPSTTWHN